MAVLGSNCYVFEETSRTINVYSYDPRLGSTERKVVSGCFAYDDPSTGQVVLLVVHQGLHIPHLAFSLIPPFQMRENDVVVNDRPKFQTVNPSEDDHALLVPQDKETWFRIPLSLRGTTSLIDVRRPNKSEIEDVDLLRLELTYQTPEWEPGSSRYADIEERLRDFRPAKGDHMSIHEVMMRPKANAIIRRMNIASREVISWFEHQGSQSASVMAGISQMFCKDTMARAMNERYGVYSLTATEGPRGFSAETLAKNWNIPLERARRTIEVTTQKGIRSRPSMLTQRFKTNDRMLRYNRLNTNMFTDTLESGTLSRRQNKYAQVFVIPPNWTKVFPMKTKGDAHHSLGTLFHDIGVPDKMIMDGSKEQTQGEFRKKLRDAGCHVHITEPYTPWSNRAEMAIRELKRKTRRQMVYSHCPKRLWDDCMELMADINSHTVHENFELDGQTPQGILTGSTPDISSLAEFRWHQWVKWFDENANFPDDQEVLARYLGPSRGVGNIMTSKLLTMKGNTIHRSTFRGLTTEEEDDPKEQERRREFDKRIAELLGQHMTMDDLPLDETPEYEVYEDDYTSPLDIPDRDDVDQNTIDRYLQAEVILPIAGEDYREKW